ncbi:MAG: cytochrome b/b6 domain-containing protein, partial [Rubrivivax sp.]
MSGELPERASSARPGEPVWDAFVRLFHWGTVLGVVLNLWVLEEGETAHRYVGYALCAGVLLRVVWGFVGTRHARFASFWPTRQRLSLHWQALKARQPDAHAGHNPLGALAMLMLMALVLLLGLTGWMQGTDAFWGDEWLEELHEGLATALE